MARSAVRAGLVITKKWRQAVRDENVKLRAIYGHEPRSNEKAPAGQGEGNTEPPTEGTALMNATATATVPATDSSVVRADQLATETITLHDWSPEQYIDKNPSGIYHMILREEPSHPIPARRSYLDAVPLGRWSHMTPERYAAHTTRGHTWHGAEDEDDHEFTFVYIGRYELVDTLISIKNGKWTGQFSISTEGK
jgi:hypothetical protein